MRLGNSKDAFIPLLLQDSLTFIIIETFEEIFP